MCRPSGCQRRIECRRHREVDDRLGRRAAGGAVGVGGIDARFAAAKPDHAAARHRGIPVPCLPVRELVHGRQQLVAAHLCDQRADAAPELHRRQFRRDQPQEGPLRVQIGYHASRRHRRAVREPHPGGGAVLTEQRSRLGVRMDGDPGLLDRLAHEGGDDSDPALDVSVVRGAPGTGTGKVDRPVGQSQRTRVMADGGRLCRMAVAQPAGREVSVAEVPHRPGQGIFQKRAIAAGRRVGANLGEGRGRPQAIRSEQFAQPPLHVRVATFRLDLFRGELQRKVARGFVIGRAPVVAVRHRHERPGAGNPYHAALFEPQVRLDPGIQRVHHVGAGRESVPRPQLFRDGRPAHEGPPLENPDPETGAGQIPRGGQTVVAAADDRDVQVMRHLFSDPAALQE